ncbi:MAG: chorismate-binding protein [Duncaniella sp.]|nr:chorismate-binding protein [Duncaniella sp.]
MTRRTGKKQLIFTDTIARATGECINRHIPFVAFMFPGDDTLRFMASTPDDEGRSIPSADAGQCFFISRFSGDEEYTAGVSAELTADDVLALIDKDPGLDYGEPDIRPSLYSTNRLNYREGLLKIRSRVRKIGGKGVLSRIKSLFTTLPPVESAESYFAANPNAFRYLCFTPETGLWLGATPELLLESDAASGTVNTMAVAGTRPISTPDDEDWDEKNVEEHLVVVDFIQECLKEHNLEVNTSEVMELDTGDVTHLVTLINGTGSKPDFPAIMHDLSPTPAVAGAPREIALTEIDIFETHRRHCYTGYVGLRTADDYIAYVNLRCAFGAEAEMDGYEGFVWNLYAGGGIMGASEVDSEWEETEMKMAPLFRCLTFAPTGKGDKKTFSSLNPSSAIISPARLPF